MNNRIKTTFLTAVVAQALHSIEELIFKLYEVFPPIMFMYRNTPGLAKSAFVAFNLLLVLFGFFCFFRWVRPAREGARVVVWVWVGIQLATVAAHVIWAVSTWGYHPGLATVVVTAPVSSYLGYALWRVPSTPPPNKLLEPTAS